MAPVLPPGDLRCAFWGLPSCFQGYIKGQHLALLHHLVLLLQEEDQPHLYSTPSSQIWCTTKPQGAYFSSPRVSRELPPLNNICNKHLCHHQDPSRKMLTILQGQLPIQCSRFGGEGEEALLLSGGIFLMCSICLPLGQCPLWRCLGCLVCVLGPFWFWLRPFVPSIVGVLSDLRLHLFE